MVRSISRSQFSRSRGSRALRNAASAALYSGERVAGTWLAAGPGNLTSAAARAPVVGDRRRSSPQANPALAPDRQVETPPTARPAGRAGSRGAEPEQSG